MSHVPSVHMYMDTHTHTVTHEPNFQFKRVQKSTQIKPSLSSDLLAFE